MSYKPRENAQKALFGKPKAIIGVVHSLPLPGAPAYDGAAMCEIYDCAVREAQRYAEGRMDGMILENHGDIHFSTPKDIGPETAASMAAMADRVCRAIGLPIGINVLANGAMTATAVAKATGAAFIRVNQCRQTLRCQRGHHRGAGRKRQHVIALGFGPKVSRYSPTST